MSFFLSPPSPIHTATDIKKRKIGACMLHRSDIVWLDINSTHQEILKKIKTHSTVDYFPVCADNIDTMIGILNVKDYLLHCLDEKDFQLSKLLIKPIFIPESITIQKTFSLLKAHKTNAACIIDEYGGIEGFVTKSILLDVLLDTATIEQTVSKQLDGGIIVSGQMSLEEMQHLNLFEDSKQLDHTDYYTLAGYLLTLFDTIPQSGDVIDIGNYTYSIVKMNGQRIDKVYIKEKIPHKIL